MREQDRVVQEKNRHVVCLQHDEIWSQGRYDELVDEVYAEDIAYNFLGNQNLRGKQEMGEFIKAHRLAFPDWKESVLRTLVDGDQVMSHYEATGTHEGEFMGIPATGFKVATTGFCISRVWNGKIVEQKAAPDMLGVRMQLMGEKPEL